MEIQYTGESLWQGQAGHFLIILAFVAAGISLFSFLFYHSSSDEKEKASWFRLGKWAFLLHSVAIFSSVAILYQLIFGHHFEYDYVRQHSNLEMPLEYLISCFWSGQQGSFLLWLFWQAVVGSILIFTTPKKWLAAVVGTFAAVQLVLTSMLLGIYMPRGIALAALFLSMNLPLYYLFRENGMRPLSTLLPGWNLFLIFRQKKLPSRWLFLLLALPLNAFLLWLLVDFGHVSHFLSEEIRLGVSPFVLSRLEFSDNAIFLFSDYLTRISPQGLNPLLQNYWMVIHPPTLFLGFTLTLVPFAFAVSGMVNRAYKDWVRPALPWTILASMILGIGILMGGMWAYEALSFGGFWAWDPVENASLVPWLTLIAGLHTLLIFRSTGRALRATVVFFLISVFLVLYSTFLTRSGILGDASVHSFTDLGMQGQLLVLIFAIVLPSLVLIIYHWKKMPVVEKEEKISSREFWMFIGSLILLFAAIQIVFSTSLPVFNKILTSVNELLGTGWRANYAVPKEQVEFYNKIQVWFGVVIALLTGGVQFLKFKESKMRIWLWRVAVPAIIALVITGIFEYFYRFENGSYLLLLFAGWFATIANLHYLITIVKGKIGRGGSTLTHAGFGLFLAFTVISLGESKVISKNYLGVDFGQGFDNNFKQNNLYLLQGQTYFMDDYEVTYTGREVEGDDYYFNILYRRFDPETGALLDSFVLRPHIMNHPAMGLVPNPSTAHFLNRDIFTHVSSIPTAGQSRRPRAIPDVQLERVAIGDSFFTSRGVMHFTGIGSLGENDSGLTAVARLSLDDMQNKVELEPVFMVTDNRFIGTPDTLEKQKLIVEVMGIDPAEGKMAFRITDYNDWVIMKAIVFPWINVLWFSVALMMIGFFISMMHRINQIKRAKKKDVKA